MRRHDEIPQGPSGCTMLLIVIGLVAWFAILYNRVKP